MPTEFKPGEEIQRGDLDVFFQDPSGNPTNVYEITYAIYYIDPGPPETEVLIGSSLRLPVNPRIGEYYAALFVPPSANIGEYRIRWTFRKSSIDVPSNVVMAFSIVEANPRQVSYSPGEQELINSLRILLRDHNPDKFYHFRPPEHEGRIGKFNRVFGQIWEDKELHEYLKRALDWWNMAPPETEYLCSVGRLLGAKPVWRTALMFGAAYWAMFAMAANWVADEFSYSIGGISLDIEKSSKYESLKANVEGQWAKLVEQKMMTVKYMVGLQQPRFGIGIRSAFGPYTARSVLSPRSFI